MILIDASVWINHLRAADERLSALLAEDQVLGHPFILGELALGYLRQRDLILRSLQRLPQAAVASDREVLRLIENERLYGRYRLHRRASAGSGPADARGEIMDPRRASTTSRSGTQLGSDAAALNSAGDAPWRLNR